MLQATFFTVFGVVEGSWNPESGEFDFTGPNKAIATLVDLLARAPGPFGGVLGEAPPVQDVAWALEDRWLTNQIEVILIQITEPLTDPAFPDYPPDGFVA